MKYRAVDIIGDVEESTATKIGKGRQLVDDNKFIRGFVSVEVTRVDGSVEVLSHNEENLLTLEGRDKIHEAVYQNAGATQTPFNYIGLSLNAGAVADTDTRTTWEIIEITSGGLERIQASTRNHTGSTNTTDLIHTWTASAIHTGVIKAGVLDVLGTGTGFLGHENTFTIANLEIGDAITITWTFTLG